MVDYLRPIINTIQNAVYRKKTMHPKRCGYTAILLDCRKYEIKTVDKYFWCFYEKNIRLRPRVHTRINK